MKISRTQLRKIILHEIKRVSEGCGGAPSIEHDGDHYDPEDMQREFGADDPLLAQHDDDYYGDDEDPDYSDLDRSAREVPELGHYPEYGDDDGAPWHARPGDKIRRPADPKAAGYSQRMYRRK